MFKKIETPMGDVIVRLSDFASIPADTGNKDYQEYLLWLDEGNTLEVIND
jgi:hypothetical protein